MSRSGETIESRSLRIRGLRVAVRISGSGDPVMLLNGMARPMESWTQVVPVERGRAARDDD